MQYQITSDNITISESMKTLTVEKLAKLERRWVDIPDENKSMRVVLNSGPDETFVVRLEANLNGEKLYTEEKGFALETALVEAVDELDRIYAKSKDKTQSRDWEERRESKVLSEEDLEELAEDAVVDTTD